MDSLPRWMPWHRKLADTVIAEWQQAMQSPEFSGAWQEARAAFHVVMLHAKHRQFLLSDAEFDQLLHEASPAILAYRESYQRFKAIMSRYIPKLVAQYGRKMDKLLFGALLQSCGVTPPPCLGNRVERLSPDNPLTLTPEGALTGWEEATDLDLMALKLHKASLRPPLTRGPKKKATTPKRGASQSKLDPILAARAYHMHEQGTHWKAIARELLPEADLNDRKEAERVRGHIKRFIERGRLNTTQQP